MSALHELQRRFRNALLSGDMRLVDTRIRGNGLPIERRLGIYRNNVFVNLRETLRTLYPVIEKLVGAEFFNYAGDEYIRRYPSPAGDLNRFGEHLAVFFSRFEPASRLPYLPDVARLEWLAHKVYHAAEHAGPSFERFGDVTPERYGELHFILNPASALLTSAYPIHRIWQVNQHGYEGDTRVDLNTGGARLLIERRAGWVELQALGAGEWTFLTSLAADEDFYAASSKALHAEPGLDLGTTLTTLVAQSTLVDFWVRGPRDA